MFNLKGFKTENKENFPYDCKTFTPKSFLKGTTTIKMAVP